MIGSLEHPLSSLSLEGSITTDGESPRKTVKGIINSHLGPSGGSRGTVLLFLRTLDIARSVILSSTGGNCSGWWRKWRNDLFSLVRHSNW